jgi:hypothetical protein
LAQIRIQVRLIFAHQDAESRRLFAGWRGVKTGGIKRGHDDYQTRVWLQADAVFRKLKRHTGARLGRLGIWRRRWPGSRLGLRSGGKDTQDYYQGNFSKHGLLISRMKPMLAGKRLMLTDALQISNLRFQISDTQIPDSRFQILR